MDTELAMRALRVVERKIGKAIERTERAAGAPQRGRTPETNLTSELYGLITARSIVQNAIMAIDFLADDGGGE